MFIGGGFHRKKIFKSRRRLSGRPKLWVARADYGEKDTARKENVRNYRNASRKIAKTSSFSLGISAAR
jgi:hypothetical protein